MSETKKIQMSQYNGTDDDILHPETETSQITDLSSYHDSTKISDPSTKANGQILAYNGSSWEAQNNTDIQINGTSIVSSGVANIPVASSSNLGVIKASINNGTYIESSSGVMTINKSDESKLIAKANNYCPVVPSNLDIAVREGLGNNSLTWSDAYKASARTTLGIEEYTASEIDTLWESI